MRAHKRQVLAVLLSVSTVIAPSWRGFNGQARAQIVSQTGVESPDSAAQLFQNGFEKYEARDFSAALDLFQKALALYQQANDLRWSTLISMIIGQTHLEMNDSAAALVAFEQALVWAKENQDGKSITLAQQWLQLARRMNNPRIVAANQLLEQGNQEYNHSQYRKAFNSWQQALEISQEVSDRPGEAKSLGNLGIAYYALGEYPKAIDFHQQSLAINREIENRRGEANALGNLGSVYDVLGEYQKAIDFHKQALAIDREIENRRGEAASLDNLGLAYRKLGEYQKAIDFHKQSLAIDREIENRRGEAASLGNLGIAYDVLGEYQKAIDFYKQSLAIDRGIGHRLGEAASLDNLGLAYSDLGEYQKAIDFHQQSLSIARAISHRLGEAQSLGNLGIAYRKLGEYQKSAKFHQQHLAISKEIGHRQGEAQSLGNLGIAYDVLGNYHKAIEFYQKSLAIEREIGDQLGEARSLGNLGNAYHYLGEYQKAIKFYQNSLSIIRGIGNRHGEAISLNNLGAAYRNTKQYSQAESSLRDAIDVYETLRQTLSSVDQVSIFETQAHTYRTLQTVHMAQDQPHQALEIAERGRTRALIQMQANHLSTDIVNVLATPPNIALLQQIAQEQNATLVEYSLLHDQSLLIWVIQPNGQITTRPVILNELGLTFTNLEDQNRQWLKNAIGKENKDNEIAKLLRGSQLISGKPNATTPPPKQNPLRTLHQYLIEPIAEQLPTAPEKRVIFIPHRSLFQVPFAALLDEGGKYLIHHHTIVTAPSIQALAFTRLHQERVQGKTGDILIVGNPTLSPDLAKDFPPLPGTEHEANAISQLLNAPKPLIGPEATETAVKQRLHKAKLIHLATHSKLINALTLNPGMIALGASSQDDGRLNTQELLDLTQDNPLNAELVVLSACETGRGRITGDGVVGLSRSLIAAGVPSVIVSLWNVEDAPTAELMVAFYRNWHEQGMDKAQALRQAMIATLQNHPDPKHWAAFTLIGEAD